MNFASFILNGPNANSEILDQPRYEGAINSIEGLTNVVDAGFIMFITFIAFFIISVAMLRNVLAGAYVAYPKFWDKVAEAHDEKREMAYYERVTGFFKEGWKSASGGSLEKFILRFVPNVKLWTDFAETDANEIAPKDYFLKAIPQMILVIIIGVFIYNGYYRDTANKITGVGAELFHRFVTEVDPTEVIYRITESSGTPDFSSDDSEDRKMQLINKISHDAYAAILSKYNDISSTAAKTQLAAAVEDWVMKCVDDKAAKYASSEKWDPKYKLTLTTSATRQQDSNSADGQTQVVVLGSINTKEFGFETTIATDEEWYLNAVATFTKQTVRKNGATFSNVTLIVQTVRESKDLGLKILPETVVDLLKSNTFTLKGTTNDNKTYEAKVKVDEKGKMLAFVDGKTNDNTKFLNANLTEMTVDGGLQITLGPNNRRHMVTKIVTTNADKEKPKFSTKEAKVFANGYGVFEDWPENIYEGTKETKANTKSSTQTTGSTVG